MKSLLYAFLILILGMAPCQAADEQPTPGVELAEQIAEITGIAISPLLGVSAVGSWNYFQESPELRDQLPWYCQPWAWGSGFGLLLLCFFKDSLGAAAPGVLKKPFDIAELLENKASALVAAVGVVPFIVQEFSRGAGPVEIPAAIVGMNLTASIDIAWLTVPLAIIAFGIVWVCSHAVNVLIILSPFSTLDTLLKIGRFAVLVMVAITYAIAPWLGAAFCVLIFFVSCLLAPAAVRLMHFGTHVATDVVLPRRAIRKLDVSMPKGFVTCRMTGLPRRICGRLFKDEKDRLGLRYRRWFLLAEKAVTVPEATHVVSKGLMMPSIIAVDGNKERKVMILLPRCRGQEEAISEALGMNGVREHAWKRGWAAIKDVWAQMRGRATLTESRGLDR